MADMKIEMKGSDMAEMKICPTGIKDLDVVLNGGFPEGACVLLAGTSGTGKTNLGLEYLLRGAKEFNEHGVYVTLTEPLFKVLRNIEGFDYYDREAVMSGAVTILDLRVLSEKSLQVYSEKTGLKTEMRILREPETLLNFIYSTIREVNAKRFVLDSVTAICQVLKEQNNIRDFIFKLGSALAGVGCTTILTSEIPPNDYVYSRFGVEEFIADGVVMLEQFARKGTLLRTLQVVKMRGVDHKRVKQLLMITRQGIKLTPLIEKA